MKASVATTAGLSAQRSTEGFPLKEEGEVVRASEFNTPSDSLVPLIYGDNPETWTTTILLAKKISKNACKIINLVIYVVKHVFLFFYINK